MKLTISYDAVFGNGDGTDCIEYTTIDLDENQAKAAIARALTNDEFDEILELAALSEIRNKIYKRIEQMEINNNLDMNDEFVMECQGLIPIDKDRLNMLVHTKDKNALSYFNLEDASDEEIKAWDAHDLDEIPTMQDFDPKFEPESPFDYGWTLNLHVSDVSVEENELIDYLKELFEKKDFYTIEDIKYYCQINFCRSIKDIIMGVARDVGCVRYIRENEE